MSVTASDIKIYAANSMPEDNTTTSGGIVNTGCRVVFDDIPTTATIRVSGTNTGDTGVFSVIGRNAAGQITRESLQLNGKTYAVTSNSYERILRLVLQSAAFLGDVNVYSHPTETLLATLEPKVTGIRRPFYDVAADAIGGSQRIFYEKVFIRNNNAVNALLSAQVTEISSGVFADVDFGLESGLLGGGQSLANRLGTAPTGVTTFGNGPTNVPSTDLLSLREQAMWLRLTLNAGASAQNSFYQFKVTGNTT